MACHRPAVVFGISYRGEGDRDHKSTNDTAYHHVAPASTAVEDAPPPPPPPPLPAAAASEQQQTNRGQEGLPGTWVDEHEQRRGLDGRGGDGREENEVARFAHSLGSRDLNPSSLPQDECTPLREAGQGDVDALLLPPHAARVEADNDFLASADGGSGEQGSSGKSSRGRGASLNESSGAGHKRNELVESWLLDVRLETETAGTALRVSEFVVLDKARNLNS